MSAVVLGIIAAALCGLSDIVARFVTQSIGVWRMMLFSQSVILVMFCAAFALHIFALPASATPAWIWIVVMVDNAAILVATVLFYHAIAGGPLSVVVPVASSYGAVTALLSAALGESLSPWCLSGILAAVIGGAIVSIPPPTAADVPALGAARYRSIAAAAASALLFGAGACIQGRYVVPALGVAVPLWLYYLMGVPVLLTAVMVLKLKLAVPPLRQWPVVIGAGTLNAAAALIVAAAAARGAVAVPAGLTALSSIVTALLAQRLFRERIAVHQWIGILFSVLGSAVINATTA